MWGLEPPRADSPCSSCSSRASPGEPLPADSLQSAAPPPDSLQPPACISLDSLESPCSLPSSPRAPPGLASPPASCSLQSDSLEHREELASFSFTPGDSLEPTAPLCRAALRPLFSLNDTLDTSSVQRDSLQSASSTQASSLPSDSLDSPCSLFDSLETSVAQGHSPGSHSV